MEPLLWLFLCPFLSTLAVMSYIYNKVLDIAYTLRSLQGHEINDAARCVVIIVGQEDDLGRNIALNLSQDSCTVFFLHLSADPGQKPLYRTSETSLLYEWHTKKKGEKHDKTWGMVAPIFLNIDSESQRSRAAETILAYCKEHSLYLKSLIFLPRPTSGKHSNYCVYQENTAEYNLGASTQTRPDTILWADTATCSIKEPLYIVHDYVHALARASGRVIVVARCPHKLFNLSPFYETHPTIIRYLRYALSPYRIRVSSVLSGPSATVIDSTEDRKQGHTVLARLQAGILRCSEVDSHRISELISAVHSARNPRPSYQLGIYPSVFAICNFVALGLVRDVLRRGHRVH
ncbi:hypothetical protein K474DRAFT_1633114 [Panus rudis PR-1116 ss-1]|nr:hypothetical protein K474DRAFT_1633114 [Panus rudis PR-1116 ss-1]